MLLFLQTLWLLSILTIAAYQDIQSRTISNQLVLTGFAGLLFIQILNQNFEPASFIIGFSLSLILWKSKFIGGGDSKLLMLISAAFEPTQLLPLYTFIAITGALQALYFLKYKLKKTLPYAVAIFMGTLCFILWQKKTSWLEVFL